jgi:predicted amidohydrolase YtcJ
LPPSVSVGAVKVLLDDSDLPAPHELVATVTAAHREGRPLAVHCVTRIQVLVALAAFAGAGAVPGDRIEHGSLIPVESIGELSRLGLLVVTQPNFVAERGDRYLADVDPAERSDLYRCRSLLDAGVAVAFGTDRPYGGADPWAVVRAAASRRTGGNQFLHPEEAVSARRALAALTGPGHAPAASRQLTPGQPGDLCLLDRPLGAVLDRLQGPQALDIDVLATVVAGRVVHRS